MIKRVSEVDNLSYPIITPASREKPSFKIISCPPKAADVVRHLHTTFPGLDGFQKCGTRLYRPQGEASQVAEAGCHPVDLRQKRRNTAVAFNLQFVIFLDFDL